MKDAYEDKDNLLLVNDSLIDTIEKQTVFSIERYKGGFYIEEGGRDFYSVFLTIDEMKKLGQEIIQRAEAYEAHLAAQQEIMIDENLAMLDYEEDDD